MQQSDFFMASTASAQEEIPQNKNTKSDAIIRKHIEIPPSDIVKQETDDDNGHKERYRGTDSEDRCFKRGKLKAELQQLEQ